MLQDIPLKPLLRLGFFAVHDSEYAKRVVDGILRYQAEVGECVVRDFRYDAKLLNIDPQWFTRQRPWESWQPDGLVVHTHNDPRMYEWIGAGGLPVVNTTSCPTPFCAVHISFDGIARLAIEHFQQRGFSKFAYIAFEGFDQRCVAFEQRLKAAGFPLTAIDYGNYPSNLDEDVDRILASDSRLDDLLRNARQPLAILANNDAVGRGVCAAAKKLGINVPRDVAVLGINNLSACRTFDPPLSSIDTPGDQVGFRAMQMLVDKINGRPIPDRVQIEPRTIHTRDSTTQMSARRPDVMQANRIMSDRACEGLTVDKMIEELAVSRSTLYRECLNLLGRTPAEEISRIRLERAKEMLADSQTAITEIAGVVGYSRSSSFTDFFKTQTGMTPRAYRQQQRVRQA
jgi:LacI family transcriptional regulator